MNFTLSALEGARSSIKLMSDAGGTCEMQFFRSSNSNRTIHHRPTVQITVAECENPFQLLYSAVNSV